MPKADGRLIVGGTVEERGFDPDLTAGGVLALLEAAWRALPTIEELPIDELWTGFRPTSRDDAPILGPTAVEGLFVATGHHRNGILLTPLTALTVSEAILSGRVPEIIRAFTIDRFAVRRRSGRRSGGAGESSMKQEIVVNGEPMPLEQATLAELVEQRASAGRRGIAVALNDAVVPRRAWPATRLKRRRPGRDRQGDGGRLSRAERGPGGDAPRGTCVGGPQRRNR